MTETYRLRDIQIKQRSRSYGSGKVSPILMVMHPPPSPLRLALLPVLGAALASCGGPSPETPPAPAAPVAVIETGPERGTVVSLRPLGTPGGGEARSRVLAQVLRATSGPGAPVAGNTMEVVVRLDRAGRDVALVQDAGWRLGQRVRLTSGERPMLSGDGG